MFSTYLGGSDYEFLYDATIDSAGSLYLTGETGSANFPTTLNAYQPTIRGSSDIWIAKMDAGASGLLYSTFVGGSFDDYPIGLVVDALGQVYVAGGTTSTNFPTVNPVQSANGGGVEDTVVLELSATGRSLLFSTYLGGLGDDIAFGLALDPSGNLGLAGYTDSTNFPTANALFASKVGGYDAFMLRLVLDRPTLTLTPSTVNFGAVNTGGTLSPRTPAQDLRLTQSGAGAVGWTASANQPWVTITPTSGTGSATLMVSINNTVGTLPVSGALSATLTVTTMMGGNNPTAAINLTMIPTGATTAPTGSLDTPLTGLTGVAGSIPVTGWAIDDIGATQIRLTRDSVPSAGEPAGQQVFIGNAVFVYGARPDIAALFPTRPYKDQAGWGYLLLTNFLPNSGNGTFRLNAFADDVEGRSTLLGTTTITCTNATATAPFGAIDIPSQGGLVSGTFVHFGWALAGQRTASGRLIPTDGSTIDVLIDSVSIGHPTYNNPRTDIQALFPGYFNTDGAVGYKMIDTTLFSNGVHTIAWIVTDNMGAAAGIGSRYFTVSNSEAPALRASGDDAARAAMQMSRATPANATLAVTHGFDDSAPPELAFPAADGVIRVRTGQLQRITIDLDRHDGRRYTYDGYTGTGGRVGPLPIGSHLDPVSGLFAWAPGLAFGGTHRLVFVRQGGGVQERILVDVSVGSPRPEAPRRD